MKVIFYFLFFLYVISSTSVSAHEIGTGAAELLPKVDTSAYALPYPGLLPGNPLYSVKMFRDRVVSLLITDPIRKAEFNLLQADKRLATGVYLIKNDKENMSLAASTILKGENYFEQAIAYAESAKKQGAHTNDIIRRLFIASHKHQEVLKDLQTKAHGDSKKDFTFALERVVKFETVLRELSQK